MNKKIFFAVFLLFAAAFILRVLYLGRGALTFTYDQARDAFNVGEILRGDVKIQGPSANAPGLNHGVFYYYFLALPYLVSGGDPLTATYWLAFFNSAAVFIAYFLCFKLTRNKTASLFSALFFTFSFKISQYATWLSNPSTALWFVPLTYLFLWLWTKRESKWSPLLTGLFFGLAVQSDLFLAYHGAAVFIWLFINKRKIFGSDILKFIAGSALGLSTLIISEIKFGFQGTNGLKYLFSGGDQIVKSKSLLDFLIIYINQLGSTFALNIFPLSLLIGGLIGLAMIIWLIGSLSHRKAKERGSWQLFLLLYIFSHFPVVFFGGLSSAYLTVGIDVAVCVAVGIAVSRVWENSKALAVLITIIIVTSGVYKIVSENRLGQTLFSTRPQMIVSNLEEAVDYTYMSSGEEPFSINSITVPLWMNTTWSYVYNWYGINKYGYLPYWHGRNQVGSLGNNLKDTPDGTGTYFLIIEPQDTIPQKFVDETLDEENSKSAVVEEKDFNGITVQKRIPFK